MKTQDMILADDRLISNMWGEDGGCGTIFFRSNKRIIVVWSWGGGWEHVSASLPNRCPTWEEMCAIKDIFWNEEETVIQFYPKKSEYVNVHPYCLHLWKKVGIDYELPPKIMV